MVLPENLGHDQGRQLRSQMLSMRSEKPRRLPDSSPFHGAVASVPASSMTIRPMAGPLPGSLTS
jgi:hypothetical protein